MNKKIIPYIYILFLSYFSHETIGQNLELNIAASDSIQTTILNEISFIKKHALKKDILDEVDRILQQVKKRGFFTARIDSISKADKTFSAHINLGKKTNKIIIINKLKPEERTKLYGASQTSELAIDSIKIKTNEFDEFTNQLLEQIDKLGKS